MRLVFPNSHRINRGNYVVKELAEACRANEITDLIVLHEHRGTPGEIFTFVDIFKVLPSLLRRIRVKYVDKFLTVLS